MDPYVRKLEQENFALKAEVEQYNRALKAACEHIALIQDSICPADMDGFGGDCSMCGNNDVIDCWVEHYLQQAKAGEAHEPDR